MWPTTNEIDDERKLYKGIKLKSEIGKGSKYSFLINMNLKRDMSNFGSIMISESFVSQRNRNFDYMLNTDIEFKFLLQMRMKS